MNLDGPWPDWLPKSPEHILNGVVCWVECCSINSWNGWSASICCCARSHGCPCDPKWPMFFWTVHRPEWVGRKTVMSLTGNSGLPRLNSWRKSSDIPLPTQSPIWVNPMGPITLSFGKKCYNVTTPGDNVHISSTKRAFTECMFLPHRLRSLHEGYFPDLIDQHSVPTGIHVNKTRSQQSSRAACNAVVSMTLCDALFDM